MKERSSKRNRLLSVALSLALLGTSVMSLMTPSKTASAVTNGNALKALLAQADGRISESDEVPVIITLSESASDYQGVDTAKLQATAALSKQENRTTQYAVAEKTQQAALKAIKNAGIDFTAKYTYNLLLNGFGAKMSFANAKKIASLPEVKNVWVASQYNRPVQPVVTPMVNENNDMIGRDGAVTNGYDGTKGIVAILDTGADVEHMDMQLADTVPVKMEKAAAEAKATEFGYGKYRTRKIPFAYNYADKNDEVKDTGPTASMHGMHVAGSAAANGDGAAGGIVGVAPKAQVLVLRVFANGSGTTSADTYVKAMEDAAKLGADSINMSLGSPAGTLESVDPGTVAALKTAADLGIITAIAAGNEGWFGEGVNKPKANNPDYGVVGTPAVAPMSLAVASVNNGTVMMQALEVVGSTPKKLVAYQDGRTVKMPFGSEFKVVDCGTGKPESFTDAIKAEVKDQIALIERGDITFVEKIKNATTAGAKMVLIYNHAAGGNAFVNMNTDGTTIPAAAILRNDGLWLKDQKPVASLKLVEGYQPSHSDEDGKMSDFSSWGISVDGHFKPEITAPGGNIYSTLNDNTRGNMSGTSMATPHVAGGISLVSKYVDSLGGYTGLDKYKLAKNILMSTAAPHVDAKDGTTNVYTSPRKQGAGVMRVDLATKAKAIVTAPDATTNTNVSKVYLGDIDNTFSFDVTITNLTDAAQTYNGKLQITTDATDKQFSALRPQLLSSTDLAAPVTVPAKGSKTVTISGDVTAKAAALAASFPNGYFLEGFVVFTSADTALPEISIPYIGFKGKFADTPPVLEQPIYNYTDLNVDAPVYYTPELLTNNDFTHLFTTQAGKQVIIGENVVNGKRTFDAGTLYVTGTVGFRGVFQRNYSALKAIVKKDGTVVKTLGNGSGKKNHFSNNPKNAKSSADTALAWTPVTSNADGAYTYTISVKPLVTGAAAQTTTFNLFLDRKAPIFEGAVWNATASTLTVTAKDPDPGSGLKELKVEYKAAVITPTGNTYTFPANTDPKDIKLTATDKAGNSVTKTAFQLTSTDIGKIVVVSKTTDGSAIPTFKTVIKNSKGEVQTSGDDLPFDTYTVEVTEIQSKYACANKSQTAALNATTKTATITFEFSKDTRPMGYLYLTPRAAKGTYTAPLSLEATLDTTGEKFALAPHWLDPSIYHVSGGVPYGNYTIRVNGPLAAGWKALNPEVKGTVSNEALWGSMVLYQGNTGKITIDTVVDPNVQIGKMDYKIGIFGDNWYSELPSLENLPEGNYEVRPSHVPAKTWVEPSYSQTELTAAEPNKTLTFKWHAVTDDTVGKLTIKSVLKSDPTKTIDVSYTVEDVTGAIMPDLNRLPFGSYIVRPITNPAYILLGDVKAKQVDITAANKDATVTFEYEVVANPSKKGILYIDLALDASYPATSMPILGTLTGTQGNVINVSLSGGLGRFPDTPHDFYTLNLTNIKDGFQYKIAKPIIHAGSMTFVDVAVTPKTAPITLTSTDGKVSVTGDSSTLDATWKIIKTDYVGPPALDAVNLTLLGAYELKLVDASGKPIQPKGEVSVKLAIPAGDDGTAQLYTINPDSGYVSTHVSKRDGANLVFNTTHFSGWAIGQLTPLATPTPTPTPTDPTNPGVTEPVVPTTPVAPAPAPQTGEKNDAPIAIAIISLSLAASLVVVKKRLKS